ncbi:hypothetical protein FACS1894194_1550 [Bacilli bacterium]|jgi:hypothetical protein|nr:hypothetical protein D931_04030 [Enterococcus faecium 13.SD.W.09]GHU45543.1 hypothetical protein FACS1894194_1550 [Bacilli bacterium]
MTSEIDGKLNKSTVVSVGGKKMDFEEKDYFMRYTKVAAQGLSKFITQGSVDEILQLDEQQSGQKQEVDAATDKSEPKNKKAPS